MNKTEEEHAPHYGYYILIDAIYNAPWKVESIVKEFPNIVNARNWTGENVIEWCIVENMLDEVELLHKYNPGISSYSVSEVCGLGHLDMLYLLLGYGVEPDLFSCRRELRGAQKNGRLTKKKIQHFRRAFARYGYNLGRI